MTDIFISYSRHDYAWVAKFAKALEDVGYKVWWDIQLVAGDDFHRTIPAVLEEARCVIVVWSKVSVEREWVRAEAYRANERKVLVPVTLENVKIPLPFNLLHAADMGSWNGKTDHPAFRRLLQGVDKYCGVRDPLPPETPPPAKKNLWAVGFVAVAALVGTGTYLQNSFPVEEKTVQLAAPSTPALETAAVAPSSSPPVVAKKTESPAPIPQLSPPEPTPEEKVKQARTWLESEDKNQWEQAVKQLQPVADFGNAEAKRLLGFAYYNGMGVKRSRTQGCKWYKQAADAGSDKAKETYAKLCS